MTNHARNHRVGKIGKAGMTCLVALIGLLALLALAACGAGAPKAKTTPTPDAKALLQQAAKASYKDMTFTLAFTMTIERQTVTGSGSGKATTDPSRFDEVMTFPLTASGKTLQVTMEIVADEAAKTGYLKLTGIPGYTTRWTKMSLANLTGSGGIDFSSLNNFDSFQNVKLIGADTIDGAAVWYIQADLPATAATPTTKTPTAATTKTPAAATATPSAPMSADIYIRQDNDHLVKLAVHTTGTTPGVITLVVTKYDSGVTITLPRV